MLNRRFWLLTASLAVALPALALFAARNKTEPEFITQESPGIPAPVDHDEKRVTNPPGNAISMHSCEDGYYSERYGLMVRCPIGWVVHEPEPGLYGVLEFTAQVYFDSNQDFFPIIIVFDGARGAATVGEYYRMPCESEWDCPAYRNLFTTAARHEEITVAGHGGTLFVDVPEGDSTNVIAFIRKNSLVQITKLNTPDFPDLAREIERAFGIIVSSIIFDP